MRTPREHVEGLRYANEFAEARSELLHLVVDVRAEADAEHAASYAKRTELAAKFLRRHAFKSPRNMVDCPDCGKNVDDCSLSAVPCDGKDARAALDALGEK